MTEYKYSVAEIDRMRRAVNRLGTAESCEDRLRTYMLNGTSPAELEVAAEEYVAAMVAKHSADMAAKAAKQLACPHDMWPLNGSILQCAICGAIRSAK